MSVREKLTASISWGCVVIGAIFSVAVGALFLIAGATQENMGYAVIAGVVLGSVSVSAFHAALYIRQLLKSAT